MAARPSIPYFAPAELLPAPLPTVAEIMTAPTRLSKEYEKAVYRVGEHFAVKFGAGVHLQEGENMLFVQQSTSIPVPKVYAIFHDKETEMDFIVQEYIPGRDLDPVWETLGTTEKQAIASQLRRYLGELRSIPSPGYYGGIWKQPIRDFHFTCRNPGDQPYKDSAISGPHETEEQWVEAMWRCLDTRTETLMARRMMSLVRRHYHGVFKGHESVFTHGNILPRNLILREDGTVVMIDWERSGWYPSFWEYCCTVMLVKYIDDWGEWIPEMLDDEYHSELGWMSLHRHAAMFD
jgi:tRNA A-37 threonylcarbamoyl transferase component Bud32